MTNRWHDCQFRKRVEFQGNVTPRRDQYEIIADTSHVYADHATAEVSMAPAQRAPQHYTDVIVSVSDDQTAKVFLIDVPSLLTIA